MVETDGIVKGSYWDHAVAPQVKPQPCKCECLDQCALPCVIDLPCRRVGNRIEPVVHDAKTGIGELRVRSNSADHNVYFNFDGAIRVPEVGTVSIGACREITLEQYPCA